MAAKPQQSRLDLARIDPAAKPQGELFDLACKFEGLAGWCLDEAVLIAARSFQPEVVWFSRPRIPTTPGTAVVVAVTNKKHFPAFRQAFPVPLLWRRRREGGLLPPGLAAMAERVLAQVRREKSVSADDWGLYPHAETDLEKADLRWLEGDGIDWESGWAALTAGLMLATDGLPVNRKVWVSAAWDDTFGVRRVEHVAEKLAVAPDWGVETVFLPAGNLEEAKTRPQGVDVWLIDSQQPGHSVDVRRLLAGLLARLGAEPDHSAEMSAQKAYYYLQRANRENQQRFYLRRLLADLSECCREKLKTSNPEFRPSHLVSVVSKSPSVVALGIASSGASHSLLLHENGQMAGNKTLLRDFCKGDLHFEPFSFSKREDEVDRVRRHIREFAAGLDRGKLAIDLTPAFKSLSFALIEAARPGDWLMYCRHQWKETDEPDLGTEQYEVWQKD